MTKYMKRSIKINKRYVPKRLSKKDKHKQVKMINKSKQMYKNKKYFTRKKLKSFKSHKSNHIINAQRMYKIDSIKPSQELSKQTKCSIGTLQKIMKKGQGAYFSSGSRPNQTAHSWGIARLASAITGGKSSAVDYKLLEEGCAKNSKALTLAKKSKEKYKFGRRKAPKIKINL